MWWTGGSLLVILLRGGRLAGAVSRRVSNVIKVICRVSNAV